MFQWKPNPNYVEGGGEWNFFIRPLNDLLPEFYLFFANQFAILAPTITDFLYGGKIISSKNLFHIHNFLKVPPIYDANGNIIGWGNVRVNLFSTLPMVPTDTSCLK